MTGMTMKLRELLRKAETWPEAAQQALADAGEEIAAGLEQGDYHATDAELAGIDRGLADAHEGRFATSEEIKAAFGAFRRG
jgi:predicted transcriptional regulator